MQAKFDPAILAASTLLVSFAASSYAVVMLAWLLAWCEAMAAARLA